MEAQERSALFYLVPSQDQDKSTWLQVNTPVKSIRGGRRGRGRELGLEARLQAAPGVRAMGTRGQVEPCRPRVCVWGATGTSGTLKPGTTSRSAVALWASPQPPALTWDPLGRTFEGRKPRNCSAWVLVREGLGGVSLKGFQAQLCSEAQVP